jgi:hypothetical protein
MKKIGYDETNFTSAIADLGRCENETKRLNDELKLLQETIDELKKKELRLMNEIDELRFQQDTTSHYNYIQNNTKGTAMDTAVATQAYDENLEKLRKSRLKNAKKAKEQDEQTFQESRFAPGSISYMIAKEQFNKKLNKGGTKTKKHKKHKTKKHKRNV